MSLPIEAHLPDLVRALDTHQNLVLAAAPGAGKTTRVPLALKLALLHKGDPDGIIWVVEPRRLAARMAARHVAAACQEPVGQSVGYRVRFDDCTSAKTRLIFMTEGLMWRCLLDKASLHNVRVVVFDEFHGRSLASDLGLAALRYNQARQAHPVQLLVMSATLSAAPIAAFLGQAPIIEVQGRSHPVSITHQTHRDKRPMEMQIASAVAQACLLSQTDPKKMGDILVFLPGVQDIHRAHKACANIAKTYNLRVLPLHGSLTPEAQDAAVRPSQGRKLILSTNVAETSITIDGVTWVIDTGLAKQASQEPWSGVSRLDLLPISQAAATQRAGRAGRTRPGFCLRLYTCNEALRRPEHAPPDITRFDLAEAQLWLAGLALPPLEHLPCLDVAPLEHSAAATTLLVRLGAVMAPQSHQPAASPLRLTTLGRALTQLPLHPRLGRLLYEAAQLGVPRFGARACALLSDTATLGELLRKPRPEHVATSDLSWWTSDVRGWSESTRQVASRLETQARRLTHALTPRRPSHEEHDAERDEALVSRVIWTGFADRVARRMPPTGMLPGELPLQLGSGGKAYLSAQSQVRGCDFLIAVHAHAQTHSSQTRRIVQIAESVSAELLLELGGAAVLDTTEVVFNSQTERVEATSRLTYDGLILEESRTKPTGGKAAPVLFQAAQALVRSRGWAAFLQTEALRTMQGRLAVAAQFDQGCQTLRLDEAGLTACLREACNNVTSFAELRAQSLLETWQQSLDPKARMALTRLSPTRVRLAGRRELNVHYAPDHPPFVSAYLQDFFGSAKGPAVADGQLMLTLHLLAPNQRPVQVTQDLSGFWVRHYPALKKELGRRYPRHAWPDDPKTAAPPPPQARGRKPRP